MYKNPAYDQNTGTRDEFMPGSNPNTARPENKFLYFLKNHSVQIGAIFLTIILIGLVAYKNIPGEKKETETEIVKDAAVNCDFSGQTELLSFAPGAETYSEVKSGDDSGLEYVAKVLSLNPFVIEILDRNPWNNLTTNHLIQTAKINESGNKIAESLKFGDIVKLGSYSYHVEGIELGIGSDFYRIEKLGDNPEFFHNDIEPFPQLNRSGRLLEYRKADGALLTIFNDGKIYYKDSRGTFIKNKILSIKEINNLLSAFANTNFNSLHNNYDFNEPSLTLICNRFQNISLRENAGIESVTKTLDNLISDLTKDLMVNIYYQSKESINVLEWPVDEPELRELKTLHDQALKYYRATGQIEKDNPVYNKLPLAILNSLPNGQGYTNQSIPTTYYKENGEVYYVSKGYGCLNDPCRENTFYTLFVKQIKPEIEEYEPVKLWPEVSGIDLSEEKSQTINNNVYMENKEYFDKIGGGSPNNNFIDDRFLYRFVTISKRETQEPESEDKKEFLLKVHEKKEIMRWNAPRPITDYISGFPREGDPSLTEIKKFYPQIIDELFTEEKSYFFVDRNGEYYLLASLNNGGLFLYSSDISMTIDGFRGYSVWEDDAIKLSEIPDEGIRIGRNVVGENRIKLQFSEERFFIEGNNIYVLSLSNEPEF